MKLKQAIHIPTGKSFFTSLFMALTFFLISLSVEGKSLCGEEKQEKSKLLNQLPDDIQKEDETPDLPKSNFTLTNQP